MTSHRRSPGLFQANGALGALGHRSAQSVRELAILGKAGVVRPAGPKTVIGELSALKNYGSTLAGGYTAAAAKGPNRVAVVDEHTSRTYAEVDTRSRRIAAGLVQLGIKPGDPVGILARNSCSFVEAAVAVSRIGAHLLLMNTFLSPQQAAEVVKRESAAAIIVDDDLAGTLNEVPDSLLRILITIDGAGAGTAGPTLADLVNSTAPEPPPPAKPGRMIVLTSGTTGTPKGARRPAPKGLGAAASMLSGLPLRSHEATMIAAPLFHAWGVGQLQLVPALGSTLVLRRRADPEVILAAVAEHKCTALMVVPVMLLRIMELPEDKRAAYDTSSLKVVASTGAALAAGLSTRFMDAFGDVLYNFYGSTESSWASIASPADLRLKPGTAGRPPLGTKLALLDGNGDPVGPGEAGRIFVGNGLLFEGYTGGADKERTNGMVSTGDIGTIDELGLLHILGRDDDMVISGGENVFPSEVEDLLGRQPEVLECAVVGVDDDAWGQRLAAYVVLRQGMSLSPDEIRDIVKSRLAKFSVPRDVVYLDALPRNATGKVVPRQLPPSR